MKKSFIRAACGMALLSAFVEPARAEGSLNVVCSLNAEWCNLVQTVFAKQSGIKVNMVQKSTGETLAQLSAEASNPKVDVWFGGTGDPHLQAAERDLTIAYQSPNINLLRDWAVEQAKQSGYRTVGIYSGPLGFAYNTELLAKKKLAAPICWQDLVQPQYKGEVQMANPNSSGTAYMVITTLVQLTGEEKAFEYLRQLHKNISQYSRSGIGPLKNVSHGESAVSISFVHDIPAEVMQGYPLKGVTPCEGTGYEVGSMSIVKGARNLVNAKKFYDWALTAPAQQLGAAAKAFQIPSNKDATLDPRMPDMKKVKLINYNFAKYGSAAERKRLLERWEKEVNSQPNS